MTLNLFFNYNCMLLLRIFMSLAFILPWASVNVCEATTEPERNDKKTTYGSLPLSFIPNQGQFDEPVLFALQGRDKSIYFTREGLTFLLTERVSPGPDFEPRSLREVEPAADGALPVTRGWALKLDFIGARQDVRPEPLEKTETLFSYFRGKPSDWISGVQACSSIIYRNLWPGVDLVFSGTTSRMKHDFIVRPGADPSSIRLAWRGADDVQTTAEGRLEISTPLGAFQDDVPIAWQDIDGHRVEVRAAYALAEPAGVQSASLAAVTDAPALATLERIHPYGFELGAYDPSKPLTLDPAVLVYSGFIGANASYDFGTAIAVDKSGHAYVTGYTHSDGAATFPVAVGPYTSPAGYNDIFVAKLNKAGTGFVYCGYIGGSGHDTGKGIAVDSAGNAYVTGSAKSTQSTFPVIVGPSLTHGGGTDEAFVAKVNAAGTALEYCGFLGGSSSETGQDIAVDSQGQAYVTGYTFSTDFPKTVGPDLSYNNNGDAFIAKVSADGSSLVYSGYIGGDGQDSGEGVAIDSQGQAYVTGWTDSSNFPPLSRAAAGEDYFIAKVAAGGSSLVYGVLSQLPGNDRGKGIAVDDLGQAYITGYTGTDENTRDAIVQKHNASGSWVNYGGTMGGSNADTGNGIALDRQGQAFIIGTTNSTNFQVVDSDGDCAVMSFDNVFLLKLNAAGNSILQSGCIGGSSGDIGGGVAVDHLGNAYITGGTQSSNFPTKNGPTLTKQSSSDAFVARIGNRGMTNPAVIGKLLD